MLPRSPRGYVHRLGFVPRPGRALPAGPAASCEGRGAGARRATPSERAPLAAVLPEPAAPARPPTSSRVRWPSPVPASLQLEATLLCGVERPVAHDDGGVAPTAAGPAPG